MRTLDRIREFRSPLPIPAAEKSEEPVGLRLPRRTRHRPERYSRCRLPKSVEASYRLHLLYVKEKAVSGLAQITQVLARIVHDDYGHLNLPLVILLDALDDGDLSGERAIHNVAARSRPHA